MAYEMKDGDISIFKNENKKEDKHPSYKGKLMIKGVLYEVALWVKGEEGKKFFSGKVAEKQAKQETASSETDDTLPF